MAKRRMFSLEIVDSDMFLDLPQSTQACYFQLAMRTDDDGFIGNPRRLLQYLGFSNDDLSLLCAKGFLIPFESGVVVVTHFNVQNTLQNDRYKPTIYDEEKSLLKKAKNKKWITMPNYTYPMFT